MLGTHFVGEITEHQVAIEFLKRGILISKPLVQSSRYDFVADIKGTLYKIQVKTGNIKDDSYLLFATSTSHTNTRKTKNISYSSTDVDYFATIYNGQCYLVPYKLCGKKEQKLRFVPTKNGQKKSVLYAEDYEMDKVLSNI